MINRRSALSLGLLSAAATISACGTGSTPAVPPGGIATPDAVGNSGFTPSRRAARDVLSVNFQTAENLAAYTRHSRLENQKGQLLAHRAGFYPQGIWPESAIESADEVVRNTPAFIEIDTRLTSDGELVCIHDETLDRETTGAGNVSDTTYAEISRLKLVDFAGNQTDFKVRTFDEWLEWSTEKAVLWVDVKDATADLLIPKVRENRAEGRVIMSAYGSENIKNFVKLAPDLVYFSPCIPELGTPTVKSIIDLGIQQDRLIGMAGYYVPDMETAMQCRELDITPMLEYSRADQRIAPQDLDEQMYSRAIETGLPLMNTEQYLGAYQYVGPEDWPVEFRT